MLASTKFSLSKGSTTVNIHRAYQTQSQLIEDLQSSLEELRQELDLIKSVIDVPIDPV